MEKVRVICVQNIFDPLPSRVIKDFEAGHPAVWYADQFFDAVPTGLELMIARNGQIIEQHNVVVRPGESLSFCAVPMGGGGGGKNMFKTIAMIAVVVVANMAGQYWANSALAGSMSSIGAGVVKAGIVGGVMVGGSLLINSVFPSKLPQFDQPQISNFEQSKTYGWDSTGNAELVGTPLPTIFGTRRIVPPILASYVETRGQSQFLNILMAVAGHHVDEIEDIYVNDQPIDNYTNVRYWTRRGANNQSLTPFFGDTRSDVAIGTKFSTSWVTRQTTSEVDYFGVGLQAPQGLWYASDNGQLQTVALEIQIQYRKVGTATWRSWVDSDGWTDVGSYVAGSVNAFRVSDKTADMLKTGDTIRVNGTNSYSIFWILPTMYSVGDDGYPWVITVNGSVTFPSTGTLEVLADSEISGRQNTPLRWFFTMSTPINGYAQYEYRFRFKTAPDSGSRYASDLYLEYHQQVIADDFRYPNTALLAVRALATDQLSGGTPRISALVSRDTVSVHNGSSYVDKDATNPAWACWHMLHDEQEGGNIPAARIVYADFEDFADWCDSKNIESHIYFDTEMSLKTAMDAVSQLGRGQVVQVGSKFTVHWDAPDSSTQRFLFTMGNIEYESFSEEWLSMEDRTDAIEVSYWDADNDYKREIINVYQDGFDTKDTSINKQSVSLPGCVSRATAAQYGKFLLNKNRYLTLTSSIGVDIDAIGCLPNDVIDVAHDVPQWGYSGRVVSATATTVVLDRDVTLEVGTTYAIEVKLSDDTRELKTLTVAVETTTDELTVTAWTSTPEQYDIYTFGELNRHYKQFRVLQISRDSELRRTIQCLEYVPEVYADSANIPVREISDLGKITGLSATEQWVRGPDGSGVSVVDLSWRVNSGDPNNIYYTQAGDGEGWELLTSTRKTYYRATGPFDQGETYRFSVSKDEPRDGERVSVRIRGKLIPPSDVENFEAYQKKGVVNFRWDHVGDIDLWGYEIREGVSWEKGAYVIDGEQKNEASYEPTKQGTHRYWIKAIDNSDIQSSNAAYVDLTITELPDINILFETDEIDAEVPDATLFNFALSTDPYLFWIPGATDTDLSTLTDDDISAYLGDTDNGTYTTQVYDMGAIILFTLRLNVDFVSTFPDATDQTYPTRTDQTHPLDTDTSVTSLANVTNQFRVSEDAITWGDWRLYVAPIDLYGRYVQLKTTTNIIHDSANFYIEQINHIQDVEDQIGTSMNEAISATGTTFTLSSDFGVSILVQYQVEVAVLGTGAKYPVVDKSTSTFDVWLFDATGTAVTGNVDITVRGY